MVNQRILPAVTVGLILGGCRIHPTDVGAPSDDGKTSDDTAVQAIAVPLTATQVLTRASLDLRGIRPTPEELALVEEDAAALSDLLDEFVADERVGVQMRDAWTRITWTKSESYLILKLGYGAQTPINLWVDVGEEIPRIVGHIVSEDLPWTEMVVGDWTMSSHGLSQYWPVDYPENDVGWEQSKYTDGRPTAGILSTNSFYWRYTSTMTNLNRGRANAMARILLCSDFMARPIEFDADVNVLDEDALNDALTNNPSCTNCHAALDPLASHFWGFSNWTTGAAAVESTAYHEQWETLWEEYSEIEPSYYGTPTGSLDALGNALAADPRLIDCAVEHTTNILLNRESDEDDMTLSTAHREVFLENGVTVRPLLRSLLDDPRYRSELPAEQGGVPIKMMSPALINSQVVELTAFSWKLDGDIDVLTSDDLGLRIMAGGMDGYSVMVPSDVPIPTLPIVQQMIAESAVSSAVERAAQGYEVPLFSAVDPTQALSGQALEDALIDLHIRVLSRTPDAAELDELTQLAELLFDTEDSTESAWKAIAAALFRDPMFVLY